LIRFGVLRLAIPTPSTFQTALTPAKLRCVDTAAFQIDRREHLENAWIRQQEMDDLLQRVQLGTMSTTVTDVRSQPHLDKLLEASGGSVVVLFFHTKASFITRNSSLTSLLAHHARKELASQLHTPSYSYVSGRLPCLPIDLASTRSTPHHPILNS
jgi:hypothetical protein